MTKVVLKHLHKVKKRLSDGRVQTYFYAWRGGPMLKHPESQAPLDIDDPLFLSVLAEARKNGIQKPAERNVKALIMEFKTSTAFPKGESTRKDYNRYLKLIEDEFGDMPIAALSDPEVRGDFMVWRDGFASTPRKADYAWTVLARVLSVAKDRGRIKVNPCERGGRIYEVDRREQLWTEEHLARLFAFASPEVSAVVMMALWTGQRQSDVLRMTWNDIVGSKIRVRQAKGKSRVAIPLGEPLLRLIDQLKRNNSVRILVNTLGKSWTSDGFRTSFYKAKEKAGITEDLTFHDLRGTAVTRMAIAGCSTLEISSVTGHSPKDVDAILEVHYLGGKVTLAEQAMMKLESKKVSL